MDLYNFLRAMVGLRPHTNRSVRFSQRQNETSTREDQNYSTITNKTISSIVIIATIVLLLLAVISVVAIFITPLIRPYVTISSIFDDIIKLTIGYFGGVIAAYARTTTLINHR